MHNGFVQVDKEKMSKSLGNFFTVREVLKQYPAEVIRYFLLASHYRSPVNYSEENLLSAQQALERFYTALRGLPEVSEKKLSLSDSVYEIFISRFNAAMDDDFNTPEALAVLFDLAREINRTRENDIQQAAKLAASLKYIAGEVLGILQQNPETFLRAGVDESEIQIIENLIVLRNEARKNKNWKESDRIRDELIARGIVLEDNTQGTTWRKM
jgi:cysteinyl-tRNA synthetase